MSGCLRESLTRSSLSLLLSRPRQNAMGDLSSHLGPVLAWTDERSRVTLEVWKEVASYEILHMIDSVEGIQNASMRLSTKNDGIHIKIRKSNNFSKKLCIRLD